MTDEITNQCSKCGRIMAWIKGTLLCIVCDASIIYDLNTPNTRKEETDWVDRTSGVEHDGNKKESGDTYY